ncbi:hypothetical protein ACIQFU_23080 [Streptomyces sp. NPDC093065]|uniref:hypothetical protein n=1 Tax=Streptomyces sp. NPDC093065 TaxID=3366021 RepID=UPI00380B31AB
MARLWTETFDSQSAAGWDTTNGTIGYDTLTPRRGAAALTCAPATAVAASIAKAAYPDDDDTAHVFLRAYVRVNTAPSARTAIIAWSDNATGATGFMCIKMNTDRTLIAGGSGATTGTASAALAIGQWYRVEMEYDDTANSIKAYLNGTLWATVTGDLGGGRYARVGVIQPAIADIDFDDIAVNDTTGASDNGLPGDEPLPPLAPNFSTIVDSFTSETVDPVWSSSYNEGGYEVTGGRARVTSSVDYNAFATAAAYTLTGSTLHAQVFPAAAGDAVAEAWTQVLIMSSTAGTDLVMEVDAVAGEINMAARTDYWDAAAVRIPYNPTTHAWFRIREDAGTLYWETAPDCETWTTRRTAATPAWGADLDLALQLISHRDAGDPTFAEFDNVNYLPTPGQTVTGSATLTAGSLLTATPRRAATGASTLTAATTLAAPGRRAAAAASTLATSSSLTATGTRSTSSTSTLTAGSTLATSSRRTTAGHATLTAGSALTANSRRAATGRSLLTGSTVIRADGRRTATGTATLHASANLGSQAVRSTHGSTTLTSSSSVTATGARTAQATAHLDADGTTTATGTAVHRAAAHLTATSTVTVTPAGSSSAAGLTAHSSLDVHGRRTAHAGTHLAAATTLTAHGTRSAVADTGLAAGSSLTTSGTRTLPAKAALAAGSGTSVTARRSGVGAAALSGHSTLTAVPASHAIVTGAAGLAARSALTTAAHHTGHGAATLTAVGALAVATATGHDVGTITLGTPHARPPAGRPYSRPPAGMPHT